MELVLYCRDDKKLYFSKIKNMKFRYTNDENRSWALFTINKIKINCDDFFDCDRIDCDECPYSFEKVNRYILDNIMNNVESLRVYYDDKDFIQDGAVIKDEKDELIEELGDKIKKLKEKNKNTKKDLKSAIEKNEELLQRIKEHMALGLSISDDELGRLSVADDSGKLSIEE